MSRIRVLVADENALFRVGISMFLAAQSEVEVVGQAASGQEAVDLASELLPDVVLMDISMPGLSGCEATRRIRRRLPQVQVLAMTGCESEEHFFRILDAGAAGYILKRSSPADLLAALRAVYNGEAYLCPTVAKLLVEDYLRKADRAEEALVRDDGLTDRELEVLRLVAEGGTNQEVADALCISVKTVEHHRAHIMEKLDLHGSAALVKYAIRKGLISVDA